MRDQVRFDHAPRQVGSVNDPAARLLRVLWRAGWPPLAVFWLNVGLVWNGWYPPGTDDVMHFSGGLVIAWFFHQLAVGFPRLLGRPSRFALGLLIISLSACAAVAWEISEFVLDPVLSISLQPSLEDTLLDILLGIVGATAYVALRLVADGLARTENSRETELRQ